MSLSQWRTAWDQLLAAGAPFEMITPADGGPRQFRHAQRTLQEVIDAGRVEPDMISQRVWKASPTVKSPEYKQKFAHGVADDLLSTFYLAVTAPMVVAPAMAKPLDPVGSSGGARLLSVLDTVFCASIGDL